MLTCRDLTAVWLGLMLPAMVICAGAPEIAPAAQLPDVFDAPETVDRESDTYTLKAYVWRDSQPLVITGDQPLSSSQTRLADNSSPLMATLYLNDQACNRETEPVIKCQTAYLLQEHGKQFEQWLSTFSNESATVRGGPGWQIGSFVEVVLQAQDAEGVFFISTNTTIQSTE